MLHSDGKTLPDCVALVAPACLREGASRRLVWHPVGEALVEAVAVPCELGVGVVEVLVGEDDCGEGAVCGVGDEAIDAVRQVVVDALEDRGEVEPPLALVPLDVKLDVSAGGACWEWVCVV